MGALIFAWIALFLDTSDKIENFYKEKLYDVEVQYSSQTISLQENVENLFLSIITPEIKALLSQTYNEENSTRLNIIRDELHKRLKDDYQFLKSRGIKLVHFHLPNGDSFLRLHKPNKFGDNLLSVRKTVEQVINTEKIVRAFEVGKHFEGFRYIFPIKLGGQYLGSVEFSLSSQSFKESLNSSLDSMFFFILKKEYMVQHLNSGYLAKNFHQSRVNKEYFIANHHNVDRGGVCLLSHIAPEVKSNMKSQESFIHHNYNSLLTGNIFTFLSIADINGVHMGYLVSVRDDWIVNKLTIELVVRVLVATILLLIIYRLYSRSIVDSYQLTQFVNFLDNTALVSKTDKYGRITYVNSKFCEISGYSKNELIGSGHSLVRSSATPKEVYRDLWKTIVSGKHWHGHLTNRKKSGENYTVLADVFPIFDPQGEVAEYIAIRHDITELELLRKELHNSLIEQSGIFKQYEDAVVNSTIVVKLNKDFEVTFVNNNYLSISGRRKGEAEGRNIIELLATEDREMFKETIERLSKGEVVKDIFRSLKQDGSQLYTKTVIKPLTDSQGNILEYLTIGIDISEVIELQHEIEDTQKEVVFRMGAIGETRSKETGNHVKRVAEYSKLLGTLYGLPDSEVELLKQASPMHDIGKVGIPDSILKKLGKLTFEEFEIMKTHSMLGYEMLKHSNRPILKTAAIVAYEHHEKWNGKGYPRGLKGNNIHIYGRITAIADVFDALGSDRIYKKAWELDRIINLLKEESGQHFDPHLINLFLQSLPKFLEIRDQFQDC